MQQKSSHCMMPFFGAHSKWSSHINTGLICSLQFQSLITTPNTWQWSAYACPYSYRLIELCWHLEWDAKQSWRQAWNFWKNFLSPT